jgi:hypothetical protein
MIGFKTIPEVIKAEDEITTSYFNLERLLTHPEPIHLQIPLYQRLYVWEIGEIKLFIEDILDAFSKKEESYYIGNMMFANTASNGNVIIDIIDGQQRFTTLWLISILLSKYNEKLRNFAFVDGSPRLSFTSRDDVNNYFASLSPITIDILSNENIDLSSDSSIEPIVTGIINIYNSIKNGKEKYNWNAALISDFGDYIFENLIMVQTTVPSKNNLNQIFESLNSGGKQLENHQILKSRFLKVLKKNEDLKDQIDELVYKWEACSNMNLYIERSVYSIVSQKWESIICPQAFNSDFDFNKANEFFTLNDYINTSSDPINLLTILKNSEKKSDNELTKESDNTKSIIGFSQFLLHTLRVYNLINQKKIVSIESKNLLLYFDTETGVFSDPENVKYFINLLFDLRFLFDKYVIKWTSEDEENQESLLVNKVYLYKSQDSISIKREFVEKNRQLSLAQSVLHIVQESKTQYWITPFLHYLYIRYFQNNVKETYDKSITSAVSFIENLDNYFYSQQNVNQNMSELSLEAYSHISKKKPTGDFKFVSDKLNQLDGTFFYRYWFYKTEYLIWKNRKHFKKLLSNFEFDLWNKYKITSKTSIEHIYPQSKNNFEEEADRNLYPEITDPVLKDYFGNLVLLTVSENSQYGALEVEDKKTKHNYKVRNNSIDSLKSSLIFRLVDVEDEDKGWEKGDWNFSKAKYHLEDQILLVYRNHFKP